MTDPESWNQWCFDCELAVPANSRRDQVTVCMECGAVLLISAARVQALRGRLDNVGRIQEHLEGVQQHSHVAEDAVAILLQGMEEGRHGIGTRVADTRGAMVQDILPSFSQAFFDPTSPVALCCVCLEAYSPGEELAMSLCGHTFHQSCIFAWLQEGNTCPVCRAVLPVDPY